ncbi:MAG: ABC transporter permease [Deltaproteobacteria bacterium]|nr:ABC transporter permease [Deltaproteobacteria bacterium]
MLLSPLVAAVRGPIDVLGRFSRFGARVLLTVPTRRWSVREFVTQAGTLTARCFIPVCATIFPFGAVIGVQGMAIFDLFGAHRLLSSLLSLVIIRELAPVLAAVLVAAQGGASFAAELGAMRIKEELDATAVMGIDPIGWHVVPRVLAMAFVVPLLTTLANAFGVAGGYVVAVGLYDQDHGVFVHHMAQLIGIFDLGASAFKGAVFGLLVGLISTWRGYGATGGAEGVGRAVNDTVVYSVMFILVVNYQLSSLLFGGTGG